MHKLKVPLLSKLPPLAHTRLQKALKFIDYEPGDTIVRQVRMLSKNNNNNNNHNDNNDNNYNNHIYVYLHAGCSVSD
jgi:hypothetical protein